MLKLALLLLALTAVFAYEKEGEVLILTDSDFPQVLQDHPHLLVKFYAPWCGHCKHLAPIYDEAATALAAEQSTITLAKVDSTVHKTVSEKYGVRGYPTLYFFKNGEPIEFKGGRSKEGIINWCNKRIQPAVSELTEVDVLQTLSSKDHVSVVLFSEDEESVKAFSTLADKDDNNRYYLAKGEALASRPAGTVEIFRSWDESKTTTDIEKLESWIGRNSNPPVTDLDNHAIEGIFRDGKYGVVLLNPTDSEIAASRVFLDFAKSFEEDFQVFFIELKKGSEHFDRLPEFLKIKNTHPRLFLIDASQQKKHVFEGNVENLSAEDLSTFIVNAHANRESGLDLQAAVDGEADSHEGHDHEGHDHDHEGHDHDHEGHDHDHDDTEGEEL